MRIGVLLIVLEEHFPGGELEVELPRVLEGCESLVL
jgi:hypothetical protein